MLNNQINKPQNFPIYDPLETDDKRNDNEKSLEFSNANQSLNISFHFVTFCFCIVFDENRMINPQKGMRKTWKLEVKKKNRENFILT